MIKFYGSSSIAKIENHPSCSYKKNVILKKDITVKAHEFSKIDTGINVECTDFSIVFSLQGFKSSSYDVISVDDKFEAQTENRDLIIFIKNYSNKDFTLKCGERIAELYLVQCSTDFFNKNKKIFQKNEFTVFSSDETEKLEGIAVEDNPNSSEKILSLKIKKGFPKLNEAMSVI